MINDDMNPMQHSNDSHINSNIAIKHLNSEQRRLNTTLTSNNTAVPHSDKVDYSSNIKIEDLKNSSSIVKKIDQEIHDDDCIKLYQEEEQLDRILNKIYSQDDQTQERQQLFDKLRDDYDQIKNQDFESYIREIYKNSDKTIPDFIQMFNDNLENLIQISIVNARTLLMNSNISFQFTARRSEDIKQNSIQRDEFRQIMLYIKTQIEILKLFPSKQILSNFKINEQNKVKFQIQKYLSIDHDISDKFATQCDQNKLNLDEQVNYITDLSIKVQSKKWELNKSTEEEYKMKNKKSFADELLQDSPTPVKNHKMDSKNLKSLIKTKKLEINDIQPQNKKSERNNSKEKDLNINIHSTVNTRLKFLKETISSKIKSKHLDKKNTSDQSIKSILSKNKLSFVIDVENDKESQKDQININKRMNGRMNSNTSDQPKREVSRSLSDRNKMNTMDFTKINKKQLTQKKYEKPNLKKTQSQEMGLNKIKISDTPEWALSKISKDDNEDSTQISVSARQKQALSQNTKKSIIDELPDDNSNIKCKPLQADQGISSKTEASEHLLKMQGKSEHDLSQTNEPVKMKLKIQSTSSGSKKDSVDSCRGRSNEAARRVQQASLTDTQQSATNLAHTFSTGDDTKTQESIIKGVNSSDLEALDGKLNQLQDRFIKQSKHISVLNETLSKQENLPLLKDKMNLILSNRSSVEYKLSNFEGLLDNFEERIQAMEQRVDQYENKFNQIPNLVTELVKKELNVINVSIKEEINSNGAINEAINENKLMNDIKLTNIKLINGSNNENNMNNSMNKYILNNNYSIGTEIIKSNIDLDHIDTIVSHDSVASEEAITTKRLDIQQSVNNLGFKLK